MLAFVGIHGVVSYATARRTQELGIRAALGASRGRIASLVPSSGVGLAGTGTLAGLAGALLGSRLLAWLLYGVGRADPATFLGVAALMLGGALLAAWIPARRAARPPRSRRSGWRSPQAERIRPRTSLSLSEAACSRMVASTLGKMPPASSRRRPKSWRRSSRESLRPWA